MTKRLHEELGNADFALRWVESYFHNRVQEVGIDRLISYPFDLCCWALQGSCLRSIGFIIYASKLFKIIEHELRRAHCYADDNQLYLSFKPNSTSQHQTLQAIENCIVKIRKWVIHDTLLKMIARLNWNNLNLNNNYLTYSQSVSPLATRQLIRNL